MYIVSSSNPSQSAWTAELLKKKSNQSLTYMYTTVHYKTLNETTTEDIELRMCVYKHQCNPLELNDMFITNIARTLYRQYDDNGSSGTSL